jgi:ADP-ribosylglycohydrolase
MIGARFERYPIKTTEFTFIPSTPTFTDDTVLTIAIADAILTDMDFGVALKHWAQKYWTVKYGRAFKRWAKTWDNMPYGSCGNGSAMRVSPVGWACEHLLHTQKMAKLTAEVTHNHPEGIKGAEAVAGAIYLARTGNPKYIVRNTTKFYSDYDLNRTIAAIRPGYKYNTTCQGSVPESIIAFLDSTDYESAVRNAISLGGDADTMACIAGGIAEAYYGGVPADVEAMVRRTLPKEMVEVIDEFYATHCMGRKNEI